MTDNSAIPFLDLVALHGEMEAELSAVFKRALSTASFIGGSMLEEFERAYAAYSGTRHCIGIASGTDALRFALMAAGIRSGDVVVTVPNTFIATAEAISQAGALPEFVDVDKRTSTMDPGELLDFLQNRCRRDPVTGQLYSRRSNRPVTAIVPVHLYGHMADMDRLLALAEEYDLLVIEDACQAHGARYFSEKHKCWKQAGTMGKASAFSFYPGKNLGACGEAGAVTSNDDEVARIVRMLRDHGQSRKYYHDIEGYNGRLDSIQAGILNVKLLHLPEWNGQRRQHAQLYNKLLSPFAGVEIPVEAYWAESVYHLYVIRVQNREGLIAELGRKKIGTGIHYPVPLHLQAAYKHLGYKPGDFPSSEKLAAEIVSLPMYPSLTADQQKFVAESVLDFIAADGPIANIQPALAS